VYRRILPGQASIIELGPESDAAVEDVIIISSNPNVVDIRDDFAKSGRILITGRSEGKTTLTIGSPDGSAVEQYFFWVVSTDPELAAQRINEVFLSSFEGGKINASHDGEVVNITGRISNDLEKSVVSKVLREYPIARDFTTTEPDPTVDLIALAASIQELIDPIEFKGDPIITAIPQSGLVGIYGVLQDDTDLALLNAAVGHVAQAKVLVNINETLSDEMYFASRVVDTIENSPSSKAELKSLIVNELRKDDIKGLVADGLPETTISSLSVSGSATFGEHIRTGSLRTGDLELRGNLTLAGERPLIYIKRYDLGRDGMVSTDVRTNDYNAGIAGIYFLGDIEEDHRGEIMNVRMMIHRGEWYIKSEFRHHEGNLTRKIDVLFISTKVSAREGDFTD